jgi:hypothetical protein
MGPLPTLASFTGRLVPQSQRLALLNVSVLFSNFICGLDSNVSAHGHRTGRGHHDVCGQLKRLQP